MIAYELITALSPVLTLWDFLSAVGCDGVCVPSFLSSVFADVSATL